MSGGARTFVHRLIRHNHHHHRRIMSAVPNQMKAVVATEGHTARVESQATVPTLKQGEILIKVEAVTLNPTDWKHIKFMSPPDVTIGCDFAGTIVDASSGDSAVKKGDKVAGMVHGGMDKHYGSFAEYVKTDASLVVKVPEDVELPRASSVGIAGYTAAQALFQRLGLNLPSKSETTLPEVSPDSPQVLVWSGATAVGQWAIQLGRAAGYHVITTASPKNHALLQKMGAAEVYDYKDEGVPEKISKEHPRLDAALDCISEGGTQSLCVRSLGSKGGKVTVLLKPEKDAQTLRNDVKIIHTLIYTCLGHTFSYGKAEFGQELVETDRKWMLQFTSGDQGLFYHLLQNKLITGNRIKTLPGGLEGIIDGLKLLEEGKVSGEKIALTF